MLGRNLRCLDWLKCMHLMFCGVVLRHDRSYRSDWCMRYGFILGRVCNCVFELFIWQVLVI